MKHTNINLGIPGICLMLCALVSALAGVAAAQAFGTTTVQGTVYLANGKPGSGTLQLSWPAFTTAANQAVTAGRTTVSIGSDGFVSVNLAPNVGSMPAGLYYTAIYHLSDGTTSTEYWVVPAAAQAAIAQVRATVMPAAQAVQAVNKAYVDQSIAQLVQSQVTSSGGSMTGPLYLNGDPATPTQAANKHYVDAQFSQTLSINGGAAAGPLTATQLGAAYQADQFQGADFGAKLQACINALNSTYGGSCDARNFSGTLSMGSNVTISKANVTVNLPCATIATSSQIIVTAGTRNVTLHGCASRGTTAASGNQGGTVFLYSGSGAMIQVGDSTYASDTLGFHLDNVVLNTTSSASATAQAVTVWRAQELHLEGLYLLGNANQTGITLDGTGNYTGGTFDDVEIGGFQTAVNAIGHKVANAATTDWVNASTFVRLHIDCPTSNGSAIAGTTGINLAQGDGNTITGGDVEGCATALHLGANAQNNTIVGLRNENSTYQVVADTGSAYNNWITGGTMFTGKLTDNGTRNSFLDTFHRSFNALNGDWFGSQQDATLTNHYRLGIGSGNERGLLTRYQTDSGYRWTTGLSDAAAGEQYYQVLDELNNVYRLSIGQYNAGQGSSNNQTVVNAAGTGAVILNGSNNAGSGGVVFGSGGPSSATVATINNAGNAQFNGSLQVSGASTFLNSTTIKNQADAEIDAFLWAGSTAPQKESVIYKDWNGNSQWYMVKDTSNNWALNSAVGGVDSFKAYQSNNSGDTYIDAANLAGVVRVNYEPGSGSAFNVYGGGSGNLYASFNGTTGIKFPGLASGSGHNCVQIDNSGYLSNTGSACSSNSVGAGTAGQLAYYPGNGTTLAGMSTTGALATLGGLPAAGGTLSGPLAGTSASFSGNVQAGTSVSSPQIGGARYAAKYGDGATNGISSAAASNQFVIADPSYPNTEKPTPYSFTASQFHYQDQRNGLQTDFFHNPSNDANSNIPFNMGNEAYPMNPGTAPKNVFCLWDTQTVNVGNGSLQSCSGFAATSNTPGFSFGNTPGIGGAFTISGTTVLNSPLITASINYLNVGLPVTGPGIPANSTIVSIGTGSFTISHNATLSATNTLTVNPAYTNAGGVAAGWNSVGQVPVVTLARGKGIKESIGITQTCTGLGDCAAFYTTVFGNGGTTAASDEGTKAGAASTYENWNIFTGPCLTGCTAGSTSITTGVAKGAQGVGRYLIDTTQSPATGHITAIAAGLSGGGQSASAITVDATVPVSTAWGTLAANVNTPNNQNPPYSTAETFVVNLTSGSFAVSSTVPVCFAGNFHDQGIVTAAGTASGTQTITVLSRAPHVAGSYIFQGGMCGMGLEVTAYTTAVGKKYNFDVVGSTDAHTLQVVKFAYSQGLTVPMTAFIYQNVTLSAATASSGTTVTVQTTGGALGNGSLQQLNGSAFLIAGLSDSALNTTCTNMQFSVMANNNVGTGTCTIAGLSGTHTTSTTGTMSLNINSYNLWPIAEVIDVQNNALTPPQVDGTLALEPNVIQFATNDTLLEPNHYSAQFTGQSVAVNIENPFNTGSGLSVGTQGLSGGGGPTGPAMGYFYNTSPESLYINGGGILTPPNGLSVQGAYEQGLIFAEGPRNGQNLIEANISTNQIADADYSYNALYLQGNSGALTASYNPATKALTFNGGQVNFVNGIGLYTGNGLAQLTFSQLSPTNHYAPVWNQTSFGTNPTKITCGAYSFIQDCGPSFNNNNHYDTYVPTSNTASSVVGNIVSFASAYDETTDSGVAVAGLVHTIASGTATMTTAAITAAACGTTVTVAAANVLSTDSISWSFNSAPAGTNAGIVSWPTAGNVNFAYCPGVTETPAAATLNWRVTR